MEIEFLSNCVYWQFVGGVIYKELEVQESLLTHVRWFHVKRLSRSILKYLTALDAAIEILFNYLTLGCILGYYQTVNISIYLVEFSPFDVRRTSLIMYLNEFLSRWMQCIEIIALSSA